jgi:2-polyprenyl-3-methyl-5-hydroxy-6-metoxy-1,4-benzoquinol methylase
MPEFRYHTVIDLSETNTSHAMVIDMIGKGRRVLDVGCGTGVVAEVLAGRGCDVVGIEMDEGAAVEAKKHVTELFVGRIQELDLGACFGSRRFDFILVADVLEHLEAPVGVLRDLASFLAPGGAIVASIPNVAHGAVRLALLQGRFSYTDAGLLDRTHLRFFTRDGVESLFEDAGLVPVEMRRTTADFFATEIPLRREDFDPEVVRQLEADPEATTYQFVVKALPDDGTQAVRDLHRREEELRVRVRELEQQVADLQVEPASVRLPSRTRQVGLLGAFDTRHPADALRLVVHRREINRRMERVAVRAFAPLAFLRPGGGGAEVMEPLRVNDDERVAELLAELDALVVVGELTTRLDELGRRYGDAAAAPDHPATLLARRLPRTDGGPVVLYSAVQSSIDPARSDDRALVEAFAAADHVTTIDPSLARLLRSLGADADVVPDPLLLLPRVLERPTRGGGYVLVHGAAGALAALPRVTAALERLREHDPAVTIATADLDGSPGEGEFAARIVEEVPGTVVLPAPKTPDEAAALVAAATTVVSSSAWVLAVAEAYLIPALSLVRPDTSQLSDRGVLLTLPAPAERDVEAARHRLDDAFDDLVRRVEAAPLQDRPEAGPALDGRFHAYEAALAAERSRRAELQRRLASLTNELDDAHAAREATVAALAAAEAHLAASRDELTALQAGKLWRWVSRARRLLARVGV